MCARRIVHRAQMSSDVPRSSVSKDWKTALALFPGIGTFHGKFSKPWKNIRLLFQAQERMGRARSKPWENRVRTFQT